MLLAAFFRKSIGGRLPNLKVGLSTVSRPVALNKTIPSKRLSKKQMSASVTTIEDDDDEFYANFDLDAAVSAALQKNMSQTAHPLSTATVTSLQNTLQEFFGYPQFRKGQAEVIQAALQGRDTCVLWSTGSGKSICYQMPALFTRKTVLVVSPLISLMTDQVKHLTSKIGPNLDGKSVACFLGSANKDPSVEEKAMRGEYLVVYITPEKLSTAGFLERLKPLQESGNLSLLAVDEAHCVSAWGHDFRKDYRNIGAFRQHFPKVPIMALTATAVPRVRDDVISSLALRAPFCSYTSVDRPNLRISVSRKTTLSADMRPLIQRLIAGDKGSTIVYVPTIKDTESVADFLRSQLAEHKIDCRVYHGSMSPEERNGTHYAFLSGVARIVVATVAFGMGIDKADVRRVVHYGAPRTFEEYYQQIGRAGRDGLPSDCHLIYADSDFAAYSSDFYTKGLTAEALASVQASTDAFRRFASSNECCRRREVLTFFGETPPYDRCGTCDNCAALRQHAGDLERDFSKEARVLLLAIDALCCSGRAPAMTAIKGVAMQSKWPAGSPPPVVTGKIAELDALRGSLPSERRSEAFLKELVSSLTLKGYLLRERVKGAATSQYQASWEVYKVSDKGREQLRTDSPVRMAVPQSLRVVEQEQEAKKQQQLRELQEAGVDLNLVPVEELSKGDGPVLQSQLHWVRTIRRHRENGQGGKADMLEKLLDLIEDWRMAKAKELFLSPAAVLGEDVARRIAYTQASDVAALRAAGVRITGVEDLAALIHHFKTTHAAAAAPDDTAAGSPQGTKRPAPDAGARELVLPAGPWTAARRWEHAIYKPGKGGTPATWEVSYQRFMAGEHVQAIAMSQPSGKPVQLEDAAAVTGLDVIKVENVGLKELLHKVVGPGRDIDPSWYSRARWWMALKRSGYKVAFADASETPTPKRPCPPLR